jgi:hypothetical protein
LSAIRKLALFVLGFMRDRDAVIEPGLVMGSRLLGRDLSVNEFISGNAPADKLSSAFVPVTTSAGCAI